MRWFQRTLLEWDEPKAVWKALARTSRQQQSVTRRMYSALAWVVGCLVAPLLGLVAQGFFPGYQIPERFMLHMLATSVAVGLVIGLLATLFSNRLRIREYEIIRSGHSHKQVWRWSDIESAEIVEREVEDQYACVLVLHLHPAPENETPALVGIADDVDLDELVAVLERCGVSVTLSVEGQGGEGACDLAYGAVVVGTEPDAEREQAISS